MHIYHNIIFLVCYNIISFDTSRTRAHANCYKIKTHKMFMRHDCIVDGSTNWGIVFRWRFQLFTTDKIFLLMVRCAWPDTTYHLNIRIILHQSSLIIRGGNAFPNFHKTVDRWTINFFLFCETWYYCVNVCEWICNIIVKNITAGK